MMGHVVTLLTVYGLALFFMFIRVVGIGTMTMISHQVITKNDVVGWVVLGSSWLYMLFLIIRLVRYGLKQRAFMDLSKDGSQTSRLFWLGLASLVGAFLSAPHDQISQGVLYVWSGLYVSALLYLSKKGWG